jgi:hypothetical protein
MTKEVVMTKEAVLTKEEKDVYIKHLRIELEDTKKRLSEALSIIKKIAHILEMDVYKNVYKT